MAKPHTNQIEEEIKKELEQIGFDEIETVFIGVKHLIREYFKASQMNTGRLREFYIKIGDKELLAALEEVIELFELQKKSNSPGKSYWCISFNQDAEAIDSYFLGGNPGMEDEGENWLLELRGQLDKMRLEEEGQAIKITAVFSRKQAIEKAKYTVWEQYKNREDSYTKIKIDLHKRITDVIKEINSQY